MQTAPAPGPRRRSRATTAVVIALVGGLLLAACSGSARPRTVHVLAASSLQDVLPAVLRPYERAHPGVPISFQFDDSKTLATQVLEGAPADVFVSADSAPVAQLAGAARVTRSAPVAENGLVIAVRRVSLIQGLDGLAKPGVRIAVGEPGTPLALLTNAALGQLDATLAASIRANFTLHDPDAGVLMSHVDLGEADAAFVYRTDLAKWPDERAVELPERAALIANRYIVAELTGAPSAAKSIVDYLLGPDARQAFAAAGFGPVTSRAIGVPTATATPTP